MSAITITDAGRNLYRDGNSGANTPLISYVAIGTNNTAPTTADIKLGSETFRKAVTSYANGTTGQIYINLYLAPGDVVGVAIKEVGFFGGNSASIAANSGVLVARGLYTHTKLNTESIQVQFVLTFS